MSKYYKEDNNESTRTLFNKSVVYRHKVMRRQDNNIVDFNSGEKIFYGRVRRDSTPIIPVGSQVMKAVRQSSPDNPPVQVVNFVADIFDEMALQFQKCVQLNKIDANDPYLSNLVAYRGYYRPATLYRDYKQTIFSSIQSLFINENIKVETFEEFIGKFKQIASRLAKTVRITFPGFVKSRDSNVLCSGLALEIADNQDASNDNSKFENFTQSKNWEFFVNTCDTYGFMIDYNVPWRIVADIDSESMRQIAQRYGYINPYDLLNRAYRNAAYHYTDANELVKDLLELYNMVRSDYWVEVSTCKDGSLIKTPKASLKYTFDDLKQNYSKRYFRELYIFLRLHEEIPELEDREIDRRVADVLQAADLPAGQGDSLALFERIINKEFDKLGSYTYIRDSNKIKKEEAFRQGKLDAIRMNNNNDISSY